MTEHARLHVDEESGVHYLDAIVYEPVLKDGKRIGWKVPDRERDRYDNPPRVAPPAHKPDEKIRPLPQMLVELEAWVDLTPQLARQIDAAYTLEPLKTTRAIATVVTGAEARRLTNPAGLLVTRLREITPARKDHDEPRRESPPARTRRDEEAASTGAPTLTQRETVTRPVEDRSDGLAVADTSTLTLDLAYYDTLEQPEDQ